jgi:hypothetical protein
MSCVWKQSMNSTVPCLPVDQIQFNSDQQSSLRLWPIEFFRNWRRGNRNKEGSCSEWCIWDTEKRTESRKEDLILPDCRALKNCLKAIINVPCSNSGTSRYLVLFAQRSVVVPILLNCFVPLREIYGISREEEIYTVPTWKVYFVWKKARVSRQRAEAAGALHIRELKVLETLRKKYLLVGMGDIDQSYVTNVDRVRSDPLDIPAAVIVSEFCHPSERARFN